MSLLIADEVHNLGAADLRTALPLNFKFRLGLSATPERHRDQAGTRAIHAYFGESVVRYSLREALQDGVLCPYRYIPVVVSLSDDELDDYLSLTRRIAQLLGGSLTAEGSPMLDALLLQRPPTGHRPGEDPSPALLSVTTPRHDPQPHLLWGRVR